MKKILFILFLISLHFFVLRINQWHLPKSLIQQKIIIQGVIDSIPEKKFYGYRFRFHAEQLNQKKLSTHFLIGWYQHAPALKVGQRWQLLVKLKPPIGSHNPGGFDYKQFLLSQGVTATGYVVTQDDHNQLQGEDNAYFLAVLRQKIKKQIMSAIHDPTLAAFISALCVGLRDGLTAPDWQVFQKTGTNHLVAIAGLHIGFVASTIYFFTNFLWRFFPRLLLVMPASRTAGIASLIAALIYSILSGFAIPAQRACIMLTCFILAQLFYYRISSLKRLLFAASMILFLNPYDLIDASFWLSFSSIAILLWVMSGRLRAASHLISWGRMQGAILIGLLPLMLFFFQQASIIAFFTNLIAIPWIGFLILPMALIATLLCTVHLSFLSQHLFGLTGKLLLPLWQFLAYSSALSFSSWHHAVSNKGVLIAGLIGSLYLLAPRGLPARWLGCFGLLPLFFYHPPYPKIGDYRITVIDVGQGLSVLVQTAHHVLLYDTGAHFPGGFDFGESVVAPYLRQLGIAQIDRLEISHGDNDHSGGADAIVKAFKVKSIFTSAPQLMMHFHATPCFAGQTWDWDGVHFDTFNPAPNTPYADNNSSCVIKVSGGGSTLLLTGDIEALTELSMLRQYGKQLQSTVLLVPHHGSRTSSSDAFITAVSPQYAIISAGKYNRYHLPAQSVITRYLQHQVKVYSTANSGAIVIDAETLKVM